METPRLPFTPTNRPEDFFEKYKLYIVGGTLLIFGLGLYLVFSPPRSQLTPNANTYPANEIAQAAGTEVTEATGQIVIDIAGGVNKPGVYHLQSTGIIEDAIQSAGGFSATADIDAVAHSVNRAEKLTDHVKIYIPKKGDQNVVYTNISSSTKPPTTSNGSSSEIININTADTAELELLPGIGPVLAQRIIDYRLQHGSYSSIEDIKKVSGMAGNRFDQLKGLITI